MRPLLFMATLVCFLSASSQGTKAITNPANYSRIVKELKAAIDSFAANPNTLKGKAVKMQFMGEPENVKYYDLKRGVFMTSGNYMQQSSEGNWIFLFLKGLDNRNDGKTLAEKVSQSLRELSFSFGKLAVGSTEDGEIMLTSNTTGSSKGIFIYLRFFTPAYNAGHEKDLQIFISDAQREDEEG